MPLKRGRRPKSGSAIATTRAEPTVDLAESPLAWLARRKDGSGQALISDVELRAGERLRADFWFAQMTPRVTANWSLLLASGAVRKGSPGQGAEIGEHVAAAQQRVRRALAAAGPDLAGVLIDVCCHLKGLESAERGGGWPKRSGKVVLGIALRLLARHYGMEREQLAERDVAPIRHWGDGAYRPRIDGGAGQGPSAAADEQEIA